MVTTQNSLLRGPNVWDTVGLARNTKLLNIVLLPSIRTKTKNVE